MVNKAMIDLEDWFLNRFENGKRIYGFLFGFLFVVGVVVVMGISLFLSTISGLLAIGFFVLVVAIVAGFACADIIG